MNRPRTVDSCARAATSNRSSRTELGKEYGRSSDCTMTDTLLSGTAHAIGAFTTMQCPYGQWWRDVVVRMAPTPPSGGLSHQAFGRSPRFIDDGWPPALAAATPRAAR